MTKIKICGLKSEQDIAYANELRPDYVGFVFLKGRTRYITPTQAAHFRKLLLPQIPAVGVFVNEPVENVISLLQSGVIQIAQLHGHERPDYFETLRNCCDQPVIKAFIIKTADDMKEALTYPSDYLLLDNGLGTGNVFDWSLIQDIHRPFFLAGGLSAENVAEAISSVRPYAVDVSSGVETNGRKDYEKMRAFIHTVRSMAESSR